MRRNQPKKVEEYIEIRVSQLKDDMNKAHDDHDKNWYNRIIQELSCVKDTEHNFYMEENISSDAIRSNMNNF